MPPKTYEEVKSWLQERAENLAISLSERLATEVTAEISPCINPKTGLPSPTGLHLFILGVGVLPFDQHIWEHGVTDFNEDFFTRCFEELDSFMCDVWASITPSAVIEIERPDWAANVGDPRMRKAYLN